MCSESSKESENLLENADNPTLQKETQLSKARQRGMLLIVLGLQGFSLFGNTCVYPFFPAVAQKKGLSATETGIVLAGYNVARSLCSPFFGSIVSMGLFYVNHKVTDWMCYCRLKS